jgi:hypothetical protein
MFGAKPNAHARRQDTLASQVNGYLYAKLCAHKLMVHYVAETNCTDFNELQDWMLNSWPKPSLELRPEDTEFMDSIRALIEGGRLKTMREHGFYNNAECRDITNIEIKSALDIATRLATIVAENRLFFPFHFPTE